MSQPRVIIIALFALSLVQLALCAYVSIEAAAVHTSSYSKLVELEKRGVVDLDESGDLSFSAPFRGVEDLHKSIFPTGFSRNQFLPIFVVVSAMHAWLLLLLTRRVKLARRDTITGRPDERGSTGGVGA